MLPYGTIVRSSPINLLQAISVPRACALCIGSILQHRDRQTRPGSENVPRVGISNARCNRGYGHRRRLAFTSARFGVAQGFQTMGMNEWSEVVPGCLVPAAAFWKVPNGRATHPQLGMKKNPYGLHWTWQADCLVINGQC